MQHQSRAADSKRIWETERDTGRVTQRELLEGFELALRTEADRERRARIAQRISELRALTANAH